MGYSAKAIRGVGWTGLLQIVLKGISLLKFVIIAKLLSPSEFGVFGIALITIAFFQAITDAGVSSYIVQTHEDEKDYISPAWIVSIARGIIIFLLTILVAYPVSIFFKTQAAFYVILIAGLIPLLNGLENPSIAKFQKNLEFNKEFMFRFPIALFDIAACTFFLLAYKSSLALIIALTLTALFETFLSFAFIRPLPHFSFNKVKLTKIFHFGKWITLISAINYLVTKTDSIIVGRLLGVELLGMYEMAQKFSLQLMSDVGYVFTKVTFPLFSKIKNEQERTKRALRRTLKYVLPVFALISLTIFIFSKNVILTFAGTKWLQANIPLKVFSLTGLITAFMAIITSLFLARARQDITAKIMLVRMVILFLIIIPAASHFGIVGASSASFASYFLVLPLAFYGLKLVFKKNNR